MPRVPQYERQVRTQALPNARRQAAETPESLGAGVGQAIAQVGETGARIGVRTFLEQQAKERDKANQIAHVAAMRRLNDWKLTAIYDSKTGALTRRGKDAFGLPEEISDQFEQVADEIESTLTAEQRVAFARVRMAERDNSLLTIHRHVDRERREYDTAEHNGYVANQKALASAQAQDPRAVDEAIRNVVAATRDYGNRNGVGKEAIDLDVAKAQNDMWSSAITQAIALGNDQLAKAYFEGAKEAGQLTGDALTKMTEAVRRGASDLAGERAAGEIWTELGPKSDEDAISLDKMEERARERFKEDPDTLKATIGALRSRKQGVDDGRRERSEQQVGTLWRAVLEGKSLEQIKRMPEYLTGNDKAVLSVVDYLETQRLREADRAWALEGRELARREREEKAREDAGWYMRWQYDRPDRLLQMSEDQILALTPDLGQRNVQDLLTRRRDYQRDAELVRQATADRELFNALAVDAGLDVHKVKKTEQDKNEIGGALAAVDAALARAQQAKGKNKLTYEEQRAEMKAVLDQRVMLNRWGKDPERVASTVVNPDDREKAYVPIDRIRPDHLQEVLNYLRPRTISAQFPQGVPEAELRARYADRIQRAYAVKLMGGTKAEQLAILDGK